MEKEWQKNATNILKAELTRRGVTYDQLQEKLAHLRIEETASINVKINRGSLLRFLSTSNESYWCKDIKNGRLNIYSSPRVALMMI
jgi:hypothetical protein